MNASIYLLCPRFAFLRPQTLTLICCFCCGTTGVQFRSSSVDYFVGTHLIFSGFSQVVALYSHTYVDILADDWNPFVLLSTPLSSRSLYIYVRDVWQMAVGCDPNPPPILYVMY
ncbi:hypothetical protein BDR05DRAFT_274482 [Suillus weaverae]|nr:hypothetical protein BDR05DRAFT_274482 [Suillus weaverae]